MTGRSSTTRCRAPRRSRGSRTDPRETPSPSNTLGVKGVGEAGTIAASPAITNAVIDALRPLGVAYINPPSAPQRIGRAIQGGGDRAGTTPAGTGRGTSGAAGPRLRADGAGRRWAMIPAEFDYVAPESLEEALCALRERRRGRQGPRRRPLADPADEAAPGDADAARRPAQGAGLHGIQRENGPDRRDDPHRRGRRRRPAGLAARRARSPTRRCAIAARSAARSPTATPRPTCRPCWWPRRAR